MHIMPTVKIALATYNGSKYICRQLDSLLAQTYPNLEIYIRDDGSTDGTVQILEEYIARNTTHKKLTLLENAAQRFIMLFLTRMISGIQIR